MLAWAERLRDLPGGYGFGDLDLDQGVQFRLDGPDGAFWLVADLAAGPGYARTATLRLSHQPDDLTRIQLGALDAAVTVLRYLDDGAWPAGNDAAPAVRHVLADQVLVRGPNLETDYAINPYVGCTIGCAFCNSRFRADDVRQLDGRRARDWGAWIDVKLDAAEVLAREVAAAAPGSVCFSPVITDPYVAIEGRLGITRACLEVLRDAGFTAAVLTRSALVTRDLDVLAAMAGAAVGVSLPTEDADLLQRLEPRGAPLADRLAVLDAARAAGVPTFAVVQPAYPRDAHRLAAVLAPRVDAVRVDGLNQADRVGYLFAGVALADPAAVESAMASAGVATDLTPLFKQLRRR